jgi:hypothetical protein
VTPQAKKLQIAQTCVASYGKKNDVIRWIANHELIAASGTKAALF